MTTIATRAKFLQNMAAGKGFINIGVTASGLSTTTTSNAGAGFHVGQILGNRIGSTLPATIQTIMLPPAPTAELMLSLAAVASSVGNTFGLYLARIYKIGTQVLTSTGNQFTHDSATFPILKTQFGAASTAIPLLPIMQITTATTTTAAVFTMKTVANGNGYVNQDGTSTVGSITLTLPATATATGSSYILPVNAADSAVTDIIAIQTNTAASAGAATIWGADILCPLNSQSTEMCVQDSLFSGISMIDLKPGSATSGTATSNLVILSMNGTTDAFSFVFGGALNV